MSKRNLPRCVCPTRDGSPCGRRVGDGSIPPVCHIHRLQAEGKGNSPIIPSVSDEPEAILKRLMKDPDPAIRLRAVTSFLDRVDKKIFQCEVCLRNEHASQSRLAFIEALTPGEFVEYGEILDRFKADARAFRERIYARLPELRPDNEPAPPTPEETAQAVQQHRQHVTTEIKRNAPPPPEEPPEPEEPAAERPAPLARGLWPQVGLFEEDGVVTHTFGNEHAQQILTGEINFEVARDQHRRAQEQAEELAASLKQPLGEQP